MKTKVEKDKIRPKKFLMRFTKSYILFMFTVFCLFSKNTRCFGIDEENNKKKGNPVFGWEQLIREERDLVYYPERFIELLNLKPGDVVVDIDPGPGYWTFPLARTVGPEGTVYAITLFPDHNKSLDAYMEKAVADKVINPFNNVILKRSPTNNIGMPPDSVDLVLLSLVGLLLDEKSAKYPDVVMRSIYAALKPKGRLIVMDVIETSELLSLLRRQGTSELAFFPRAKDTGTVQRNCAKFGFVFKQEFDLYRNEEHKKNIFKIKKSGFLRSVPDREIAVFISERFVLIFEKPEHASDPLKVEMQFR